MRRRGREGQWEWKDGAFPRPLLFDERQERCIVCCAQYENLIGIYASIEWNNFNFRCLNNNNASIFPSFRYSCRDNEIIIART